MNREQPSPDHTDPVDDLKRIIRAGQPADPPPSPEPDRAEAKKEAEPPSDGPQPAKPRKPSVAIYLTVMFAAAFLMLLLAYFVQQRNIGNLQNSVDSFATVDELRAENQLLRERAAQADELEQELAELQAEHQELCRAVERNEQYMQSLEQESRLFRFYCILENQLRNGYYEAAARTLTSLYDNRQDYNLSLGLVGNEPNPSTDFDLVTRLNEISQQLEGMGLIEPGTIMF